MNERPADSPEYDVDLEALRAQRERCLDSAALLAALFSAGSHAIHSLRMLSSRQDGLMHEHLHQFAFFGRRYVELAQRIWPDLREGLASCTLPAVSDHMGIPDKPVTIWWVFSRLLHSVEVRVDRLDEPHYADDHPLPPGVLWGFTVRSDRDPVGHPHFFHLEFLLTALLSFDGLVAAKLAAGKASSG